MSRAQDTPGHSQYYLYPVYDGYFCQKYTIHDIQFGFLPKYVIEQLNMFILCR